MHIRSSIAAALAMAVALAGFASAAPSGPSQAQIRAAVRRAERSPNLWATINICNIASTAPAGSRLMGVRVQMPGLGFRTRLIVGVRVEYWSTAQKRYLDAGAHFGPQSIGTATKTPLQSGVSFHFKPPAAGIQFLLRGVATFEWRIGNTVLGRATRTTGHGYRHVDFSNPPGYSASTCRIQASPS